MIILREIEVKDIPSIQKYASHPSIGKMSNVPSPYPENGAEIWYASIQKSTSKGITKVFVIERESEFSGVITLNDICHKQNRVNVDYWIRSDFHNKGVGTSAVGRVIEKAKELGINNYYSGCLARNYGSKKVLLKNGFTVYKTEIMPSGKYQGEEIVLLSKTRT